MAEGAADLTFREATKDDVPAVVRLLREDSLGAQRETGDPDDYLVAFDQMRTEAANRLIVAEIAGRIVGTFQITFITGLSHRATRRAQVESVRVAADLRGQGIGRRMMAEAERMAREAGCGMLQLTTTAERDRARAFYESLGYVPSHIGFKHML